MPKKIGGTEQDMLCGPGCMCVVYKYTLVFSTLTCYLWHFLAHLTRPDGNTGDMWWLRLRVIQNRFLLSRISKTQGASTSRQWSQDHTTIHDIVKSSWKKRKTMDNNSFNMDERNGKKASLPKRDSESSLLGQMLKKTSLIMAQVSDGFEPSSELRSAIKEENIAEIRWVEDGRINDSYIDTRTPFAELVDFWNGVWIKRRFCHYIQDLSFKVDIKDFY